MSEWKTIDSAPKDKRILVFDGTEITTASWHAYMVEGADRGSWFASFDCCYQWDKDPTHWMELPEGPQ